jgi:glycosyltransferase involved in cell wall biosynthesis
MKNKIVIFGDDPRCTTGFALVVRNMVEAAEQAGLVSVIVGKGSAHPDIKYGYPVINANERGDAYGWKTLEETLQSSGARVVVTVGDQWDLQHLYGIKKQFPFFWIGYTPVEAEPFPAWIPMAGKPGQYFDVGKLFGCTDHVVAYTRFGKSAIEKSIAEYNGLADTPVAPRISQVYHGVDTDFFKPMDRVKARKALADLGIKKDDLLFTTIKTNSTRAGFDTLFDAWDVYRKSVPRDIAIRSKLYIHTTPDGPAYPLPAMCHHYGCTGSVIFDRTLVPGAGCTNERIRNIYNATDVFLSTARGEGFGLPVAEAMACGVPVVVPDYAGPAEYVGAGGYRIPIIATYQPEFLYTRFAIVDAVAMADRMRILATVPAERGKTGIAARKEMLAYPWTRFHNAFSDIMEDGIAAAEKMDLNAVRGDWV